MMFPEQRSRRVRLWVRLMTVMLCCGWGSVVFADSSSFYCNSQIVSVGNTLAEVLLKCGPPSWADATETETVTRVSATEWRTVRQTLTNWLYNWGASNLTRLLSFENGALTTIKTGAYSMTMTARQCQFSSLTPGMSKLDVLARCGKPLSEQSYRIQELVKVQVLLRNDPDEWELLRTPTEEWVYQFAPDPLVRVLTFKDSRLREIKTIAGNTAPLPEACKTPGIAPGMTKAEIVGHCGLPIWQSDRKKTTTVSAPNGRVFSREVLISEWAYRLKDHATATLTFQDGRLMEIVESQLEK
jgi:hypothetical protein